MPCPCGSVCNCQGTCYCFTRVCQCESCSAVRANTVSDCRNIPAERRTRKALNRKTRSQKSSCQTKMKEKKSNSDSESRPSAVAIVRSNVWASGVCTRNNNCAIHTNVKHREASTNILSLSGSQNLNNPGQDTLPRYGSSNVGPEDPSFTKSSCQAKKMKEKKSNSNSETQRSTVAIVTSNVGVSGVCTTDNCALPAKNKHREVSTNILSHSSSQTNVGPRRYSGTPSNLSTFSDALRALSITSPSNLNLLIPGFANLFPRIRYESPYLSPPRYCVPHIRSAVPYCRLEATRRESTSIRNTTQWSLVTNPYVAVCAKEMTSRERVINWLNSMEDTTFNPVEEPSDSPKSAASAGEQPDDPPRAEEIQEVKDKSETHVDEKGNEPEIVNKSHETERTNASHKRK